MSNKNFCIEVESRTDLGTANSRRLRRTGAVPAVIYGLGTGSQAITIPEKDLKDLQHHSGATEVKIDGKDAVVAIVKDVQIHPVNSRVLHVDLLEVDVTKAIQVSVGIEATGTPAGASEGGALEQMVHEIEVSCLPNELVDFIEIDVSDMELDTTMHAGELVLPKGFELASDPETAVFQVRVPRLMEEESEEGEGEEGAEGEEAAEGEDAAEEQAEEATE